MTTSKQSRFSQFAFSVILLQLAFIAGTQAQAQIAIDPPEVQQADNEKESRDKERIEPTFVSGSRQLTFEGLRAGEGYFSADGNSMVFQSERIDGNPFFQIFVLDFETGDIEQVSPGQGKTTCAWIHPDGSKVIYASTQDDPEAEAKQLEELRMREEGTERRYSWDYDSNYELFEYDRAEKTYRKMTDAVGYDAEGSYSPDGSLIAFASNRNAYSTELSEEEKKVFETDPACMMDIFIMNADGTGVKQLTDVPGYDGGPFFSPDGSRICWRRFAENGATAEIMTMNIDGSDQRQLTNMRAMSWAPFYHPSGKYLIYTTNKHGFGNFELYLIDVEGKSNPVRVTETDGFDGLASFTPDGTQLTWTSNRSEKNLSQIYLADWNHEAALSALGESISDPEITAASDTGRSTAAETKSGFDQADIGRHVKYLCQKELGGRMTGTRGERQATAYVAAYMDSLGLVPAGDDGSWFQEFEFVAGAELGDGNSLSVNGIVDQEPELPREEGGGTPDQLKTGEDWMPLSFSANTEVEAGVVFAGYGIDAPEVGDNAAYTSWGDLDVEGKWVMVFRFLPEDVPAERRQFLKFYSEIRKKDFQARGRGAVGLIVVSGPTSGVNNQLTGLASDFSESGSSIPVVSITDDLAQSWLSVAGKDLATLQKEFDSGQAATGFALEGVTVRCKTEVKKIVGNGRNVIGRLLAGETQSETSILVGAHIDHLGNGQTSGSLAKNDEKGQVHAGADDNASGVAGMLEIAEYLSGQQRAGKLELKRDVIFAGWSGEELGLLGSKYFVESLQAELMANSENLEEPGEEVMEYVVVVNEDGSLTAAGQDQSFEKTAEIFGYIASSHPDFTVVVRSCAATKTEHVVKIIDLAKECGIDKLSLSVGNLTEETDSATADSNGIYPHIAAALNMDMIGRMSDNVVLQGVSSSDYWPGAIESKNAVVGLPVSPSSETNLPTDASSFYVAGVPILSAFTGSHTDYHTPRDTPEKLNYIDATRIARLMGLIARSLATSDELPNFIEHESEPDKVVRGGLRAYLGSVPSYGEDVKGVLLSDVTKDAPMDKAGVEGGDIIVELAGTKIENIYDYTAAIDGLKVNQEVDIVVMRAGKRVKLKVTPGSRE